MNPFDLLPYALALAVGLAGLLFAPAVDRLVDRWAERFDAWLEGRLSGAHR